MFEKIGNSGSIAFEKDSTIFDKGEALSSDIFIKKGVTLSYLFLPKNDGVYTRNFSLEEGAIFHGSGIAIGTNMVLKMSVCIEGSSVDAALNLLGLATDGSTIEMDGRGTVALGCDSIKLRVDQTNILLGKNARVRGRPVLEVATDSIEGGHSCRIHQISGDALFYLESHGIDSQTAEGMLLEAEILRHVGVIGEGRMDIKREVLERIKK